jgi:hypothetical protein
VPQIRQLGRLVLECKLENVVRLDEFPNLRSCELFWSKDVSSVFECTRLEELCLWLYPMRDLSNLQSHARLRELRLLRLPNLETLKGLSGLQQLEYLMVKHAPRLRDVSEIGALPKIKELNVFACPRVKDIEPIANAKALSTVTMGRIGTIPSLRFAETMPLVEHLSMAKVVVEDLDLSFVSSMPALRSFVIAKRKGQHPTLNEIWDELEARRTALRH